MTRGYDLHGLVAIAEPGHALESHLGPFASDAVVPNVVIDTTGAPAAATARRTSGMRVGSSGPMLLDSFGRCAVADPSAWVGDMCVLGVDPQFDPAALWRR